jgi:hypothetical protein
MLTRLAFAAHRALQATPLQWLKDLHRQFLGSSAGIVANGIFIREDMAVVGSSGCLNGFFGKHE